MEELSGLLQRNVSILTSTGKTFTGTLSGIDTDTLSLCLTNAKDDKGAGMHKVFLNGDTSMQISSFEKPFDLPSLGERLERVFPRVVGVLEDAGVVVVMDGSSVSEKGIIEEAEADAERV